jgi:hypothetical protein
MRLFSFYDGILDVKFALWILQFSEFTDVTILTFFCRMVKKTLYVAAYRSYNFKHIVKYLKVFNA